jgi:hypothetical protein
MCGYHGSLLALWLIASHDRAWILCWCANYECLGLKISSYFYNKPQESVSQVKVLVCAIPIWAWITVRLRGAQCGKPNQSHHPSNHQLYRGSLKNHRHKVILTHLAAGTASGEDIFARRAKSTPLVVMVLSLGSSNRCLNPNTLGIPIYAHGLLLDILDNSWSLTWKHSRNTYKLPKLFKTELQLRNTLSLDKLLKQGTEQVANLKHVEMSFFLFGNPEKLGVSPAKFLSSWYPDYTLRHRSWWFKNIWNPSGNFSPFFEFYRKCFGG